MNKHHPKEQHCSRDDTDVTSNIHKTENNKQDEQNSFHDPTRNHSICMACATINSILSKDGGMHRSLTIITSLSLSTYSTNYKNDINNKGIRRVEGKVQLVLPIHQGIFLDVDHPFRTLVSSSPTSSSSSCETTHLCTPCSIHISNHSSSSFLYSRPTRIQHTLSTCFVQLISSSPNTTNYHDDHTWIHHMNVESPSFESTQHVSSFQLSFSLEYYTITTTSTSTTPIHSLETNLNLSFQIMLHARYNEPISWKEDDNDDVDDTLIMTTKQKRIPAIRLIYIQSPWIHSTNSFIQVYHTSSPTNSSNTGQSILIHSIPVMDDCSHCTTTWPTTTHPTWNNLPTRQVSHSIWEVNVGRMEHYTIVMSITLLVSTLGTIWMMRELYHLSLRLSTKELDYRS